MITKERLEELLEEDKVFYWVFNKEISILHKLSMPTFWKRKWEFYSKDCFETKEDAEEYAEFGNITRTERLKLPSWEQVQDGFYYNGSVPIYEDDRNLCFISTSKDIVLKNYASLKNQTKFNKPLTRENYNEARRLCVKLFKGEE